MNLGNTDITVDGIAMTTSVKSQLTSSDGTVDIIELRRRIERKEADIKRKDREIGSLQRDLQKISKESKDLQQTNHDLTRSLSNARMLNASVLDDSVQVELRHRISDLEGQLAQSEASVNDIKGELEAVRASHSGLEEGMEVTTSHQEYTTHLHRTAMKDVEDLNIKVKMLQVQVSDREDKMEAMRKEIEKTKESERRFKSMTEHQGMLLSAHEKTLADQSAEIRGLKGAIQVRNETNSSLRNQVEELSDNNFVLSKTEMDHLRKMEKDNEAYQTRIRDLVKSVELHMDLLQRAEAETAALRQQSEENTALLTEYKKKSEDRVQLSESDNTTLKFLKKETVKLRNENKDLTQRLQTASAELHALQSLRGGAAGAGMPGFKGGVDNSIHNGNKMASASNEQDRMMRQSAEEATRALRNRMSFLLEQMEQASQLAASWQEQKAILKAEIGSLLRANHDLRERLLSVQRNFMGQTLYEAGVGRAQAMGNNQAAFLTSAVDGYQQHEASERLAEGLLALDQMGDSLQGPYMQSVPSSAEAMVERKLFDAVCAFSLGTRVEYDGEGPNGSPMKTKPKRRPIKLKGVYKISQTPDNRVDIYVEDGDVDAAELLASLQIPAFLKFVQSRPADKIPKLFTEKMANVLNFSRRSVHDFLEQLGDARMQLGKLQSKVSVSWERVGRIRDRCTKERLSKQKSVMRYIREQLRISDIRKILAEVGERAAEHLDDLVHTERGGLLGMRDQAMRDTMSSLVNACSSLTALSTGTADGAGDSSQLTASISSGAIEVRLADTQLDDETLHGVVGLLCGVLAPGAQDLGGSKQNDSYDGYHRMVAGDGESSAPMDRNTGGTDILLSSLGVKVSERQVAMSNNLARSILAVKCDYTERIVLMNLRGNALTDLSCKVLAAMVEKSSTLRMLDLRENLLSTTGAKFLFDATRRNITVLYVTQRQNGYMIEGHREILGNGNPRSKQKGGGNTYENPGMDISESHYGVDEDPVDNRRAQSNENNEDPKHPLRIDMRNNNPSKEAIEALLESVDYTSAVRYIPPAEGERPDPPLSLQNIVDDTRTFEEAYSGHAIKSAEPYQMRTGDEHSSFTPAGLTRNQFSGMLSTAQSDNVHPYGNGEKRARPHSAGGYATQSSAVSSGRPMSAAMTASIGNKLYNSVKANRRRGYSDDDDDEDVELGEGITEMIISRKDREKGINGVGGLIEQQIRKLQLTQPMNTSAEEGRSKHVDNSWEAFSNKRKAERNSKNKDFSASGPRRQQDAVNAYSSTMPNPRTTTPEKSRCTFGTVKAETVQASNNVSGFVSELRRAKSTAQIRPQSAASGLSRSRTANNAMMAKSTPRKSKQSEAPRNNGQGSMASSTSSLPRVVNSNKGGKSHHEALQTKQLGGYNLNPTLLF